MAVFALIIMIAVGAFAGLMLRYAKAQATLPAPPQDLTLMRVEMQQLRDELEQTKTELQQLTERQQFVEALLEKRADPTLLPRS